MSKTQGPKQIKTVRCPYIPEHIMPQQSLLNHLSKCSATNKHLFTKCRYNPLHVYPNTLIEDHYKKCKDRIKYQQKNGQSSDDWDSDSEKKQQLPKPVINAAPRQGNKRGSRKEKQLLEQSTIQKIQKINLNESDDQSWDPIIQELTYKQKVAKNINHSVSTTSKANKTEPRYKQNGNKSKLSSQNSSFQEKSTVKKHNNKSLQQQNSKIMKKKQQNSDESNIISLESQSFSQKEKEIDQKQSLNQNERSYQTLKSYSDQSKNGDNQKNNSKIHSKSVIDEDLQVDDF